MISPTGSKQKGNKWERDTCKTFSLWITGGERPDIFSRNVLSGGRFTNVERKDGLFGGLPGDVIASHPLAFAFAQVFSIECKHGVAPEIDKFLLDTEGKSFLAKTFAKAQLQAAKVGLTTLVVARKNRNAPFVLMEGVIGTLAAKSARSGYVDHVLHNGLFTLTLLKNLITFVDPAVFLAAAGVLLKERASDSIDKFNGSTDRHGAKRGDGGDETNPEPSEHGHPAQRGEPDQARAARPRRRLVARDC